MTPGSFTAKTPGGAPIAYTEADGFTGELADILNDEFERWPGHTHTPAALLAAEMLQHILPGVIISNLTYAPLPEVSRESALP